MPKVTDITSNAFEDGVEDYFSTVLYRRMKSITDPIKKEFSSDSAFDEAMQSFIQTLSIGLTMFAMQKVMSFFFERGVAYLTSVYTFIVAGKLKRAIRNKLKASKFRGLKAFKIVGRVLDLDRTPERIEMAKIVQSNVDTYDKYKMHYETQNNSINNRLDTFSNGISNYKGTKDMRVMNLFNDLTLRGAWLNTSTHKKIYENATGTDLSLLGVSWATLSKQLNQYTQFAKTANDEILNLTESINKLVATKGS